MRKLFAAGLKLYGVSLLVSGLLALLSFFVAREAPNAVLLYGLGRVAAAALCVMLADRIAALLRLEESSAGLPAVPARTALRVGLVLIGAKAFLDAAPAYLKEMRMLVMTSYYSPVPMVPVSSLLLIAAPLALPLLLILAAGPLSRRFDR